MATLTHDSLGGISVSESAFHAFHAPNIGHGSSRGRRVIDLSFIASLRVLITRRSAARFSRRSQRTHSRSGTQKIRI